MRAGFPPVIIRRADRFSFHSNTYSTTLGSYNFNREVYYKHLQTANEGDIRPFIRLNLFHFPKPIQHDSCVQVHSVVYGENVGGVPVGQPGVHHGGGGGRVHQPSPKPCRGFHRGSWHCCEKVRLPQIVISYPPPVMIFHQVQAEPGKALVKPGGGGGWGWRRSYQVKMPNMWHVQKIWIEGGFTGLIKFLTQVKRWKKGRNCIDNGRRGYYNILIWPPWQSIKQNQICDIWYDVAWLVVTIIWWSKWQYCWRLNVHQNKHV